MEWAVGGAIEHGSFMMAVVAVALTCMVILIAISGLVAYIRVKHYAKIAAITQADETAREVAEQVANLYLQAEIHGIISAYSELGQTEDGKKADQVALQQEEREDD